MEIPKPLVRAMLVPLSLVALMWSLEAWDFMLTKMVIRDKMDLPHKGYGLLDGFGIRPRELAGLPGILFAPFLHHGLGHLIGNTWPLLVLSFVLALSGMKRFFAATGIIILASGLGVWLFGRGHAVHIGASGIVLGYIGFLLVKGFLERRLRWVIVSIATLLIYGSMLTSLIPFGGEQQVSYSYHLFGFLSGILAAWLLAPRIRDSDTVNPMLEGS